MTTHANPTLERDIQRVAADTGLLPSVVRACLTTYAAEAKAAAWDEGWEAGASWPQLDRNPYRSRDHDGLQCAKVADMQYGRELRCRMDAGHEGKCLL